MLIVKKLFNVQVIFNSPNLVAHYNYNETFQKSNVVDYRYKYGVYTYTKHIQNYNATKKN